MEVISERKKEILFKTIEDYIQDASPITSLAVQKKHLQNISSATLRNELSALEAMGYLRQLHTSGGRVPTTKAYRFFVNELMKETKFDVKSLSTVKNIFQKRSANLTEIVNSIATLVSEATNYPTVVVFNGYEHLIVESIKIIPLIDGTGIVLIGTKNGIINNTINFSKKVSEESCIDASNFLTRKFAGKTIADIVDNIMEWNKELNLEISQYEELFTNLIDCLKGLSQAKPNVYSSGMTKLLNEPEYKDVDSVKKILDLLEDDTKVKNIINGSDGKEISFSIGSENQDEELGSCSVVTANYLVNGEKIASIGVIGPERMNYSKTANALKFIVDELKKINQLYDDKEDKK